MIKLNNPFKRNAVTRIHSYEEMPNGTVSTTWDRGTWTVNVTPRRQNDNMWVERNLEGRGSIQFMNEQRELLMQSMGLNG